MTNREKCAGGIIINPFINNIANYNEYKILIVKQKYTNYWGLPKGHVEENENLIETAKREIFEETGIDFALLKKENDYEEVNIEKNKMFKNLVVIKKIYFFVFVLLKNLQFNRFRSNEIIDIKWISLEQLKKNKHLKLNRTLCLTSLTTIENVLIKTKDFLSENYEVT